MTILDAKFGLKNIFLVVCCRGAAEKKVFASNRRLFTLGGDILLMRDEQVNCSSVQRHIFLQLCMSLTPCRHNA